ncbi:MAG: hypothetical protein JSW08_01240 [archaeon]|nr:MAG: hypothetical protein JSW08_01240 [archaeon]
MRRICKQKKGQIGEITHDFTAFIMAFLIIVLFFVASLWVESSNERAINMKAEEFQDNIRVKYTLNNLLKKEVTVSINNEIQKVSFADLIRLSQMEERYKYQISGIEEDLERFCMQNQEKKTYQCHFMIEEIENKCPLPSKKGTSYISCLILPSNKNIAVSMLAFHSAVVI